MMLTIHFYFSLSIIQFFFSFYFETCKLDTSELFYLDTTSKMLYKLLYVVYAEFVFIGF